jgi:hypothetical protein
MRGYPILLWYLGICRSLPYSVDAPFPGGIWVDVDNLLSGMVSALPQQSPTGSPKIQSDCLKVHMHEIFIICFYTIFCIFQSLMDKKRSRASIFEIFFKFALIFEISDHCPFSPKARRMAERCHRKRRVKFSAVFVTVHLFIVLSIFGEKMESNIAFLAKARS